MSANTDIAVFMNENRGSCYLDITDAPFWSSLNFDDEKDDDLMFIETHCCVVSAERYKSYRIIDSRFVADDDPDKEAIEKKFAEPGPSHVHPSAITRGRILNGFEKIANKYGRDKFENMILSLYQDYPTPDPNDDTIKYLQSKRDGVVVINMRWKYIYEFMTSIHEYFYRQGIDL